MWTKEGPKLLLQEDYVDRKEMLGERIFLYDIINTRSSDNEVFISRVALFCTFVRLFLLKQKDIFYGSS